MHADRDWIADDPDEGVMSIVWGRMRRRAWSRAGAVAAVVSSGPARRIGTLSVQVAMLTFGSFLISVSVAVTLWTGLGPGPLDVFIGAMRSLTGLPLSVAVWATVGSIIAIARLLGRRPGVGTFLSPFLIGPMLQASASVLDSSEVPVSIVVRLALQVVAIGGIGIGSGALVVSGLGAGSGELFAGAASDRVHRSEPTTRFWVELMWIVTGVALGGPAGFGTVMVATLIGPAVFHGQRPALSRPRWMKLGVVGDRAVVAEHHVAVEVAKEPPVVGDGDDRAVDRRGAAWSRRPSTSERTPR